MALSDPFDNTPPAAITLPGQSFSNTPPDFAPVPNSAFDDTEPEELILTSIPLPSPIGQRPMLAIVQGPQVTAAALNAETGNTDVTTSLPFPDRIPEDATLQIRIQMPSDIFDDGAIFGGFPVAGGIKSFYHNYPKGDGGYIFQARYVSASKVSEWSQPFAVAISLG